MKVYEGDTVAIQADSAYVIGQAQAFLINERLVALQQAQQRNLELNKTNAAVMSKVAEIEEQLKRLIAQLLLDNQLVSSQLLLLMADLDKSIVIIRESNHDLQENNDQLKEKLAHLNLTVKHLRKENRRMSRKNRMEKIVIGVASLALGFVVGSVR
ncbi:MAG: hypothetical protein ACNS60_17430 [Candidatus Cyclobacteriaceae bacterium M2_1C_046]